MTLLKCVCALIPLLSVSTAKASKLISKIFPTSRIWYSLDEWLSSRLEQENAMSQDIYNTAGGRVASRARRRGRTHFISLLFFYGAVNGTLGHMQGKYSSNQAISQLQGSQILKWEKHLDRPFPIEYIKKLTTQSALHCCDKNLRAKSTQEERYISVHCRGLSPGLRVAWCWLCWGKITWPGGCGGSRAAHFMTVGSR